MRRFGIIEAINKQITENRLIAFLSAFSEFHTFGNVGAGGLSKKHRCGKNSAGAKPCLGRRSRARTIAIR